MNYIFDLYGTLLDLEIDEASSGLWMHMCEIYEELGAVYTPNLLREKYIEKCRQVEEKLQKETRYASPEIQLQEVFAELIVEGSSLNFVKRNDSDFQDHYDILVDSYRHDEKLMHRISKVFREESTVRRKLYPHVLETLKALKERGHHLYLLSNAQAIFTIDELKEEGLYPFFDAIYISSDYQMRKPMTEFLEKLMVGERLDTNRCIMVGNDMFTDMEIAAKGRLKGIFLNTDGLTKEEIEKRKLEMQKETKTGFEPVVVLNGDISKIL